MKIRELFMMLTLILFVLISGCKKDGFQPNVGVCPQVLSTIPANGAVGVPLNQVVTVAFNEKMNASTITSASFTVIDETKSATLKAAVVVTGTFSFSGKIAYFTPTSPLAVNTTYTGRLTRDIRDMVGSTLQAEYVWTFKTDLNPTVTPSPINNAVNVPLGTAIVATFSAPLDSASIKSVTTAFTVKQGTTVVPGNIIFDTNSATFLPTTPLLPFTTYTGTLTTSVKNSLGTPLATDFTWSFITIPQLILSPIPVLGGTTSGSGLYSQGSAVTAVAVANTGYSFVNWTDGVAVVSTSASYQFVMAGNKALVANFAPKLQVSVTSNPVLGGTSSGGGSFNTGLSVTVNALANTGYTFTNWTEGVVVASTNASYTFTITGNRILVANYSTSAGSSPMVDLQSAGRFAILSGVGISNNAGFSVINNMDVGIYPGARSSVTGFPPAIVVGGAIYASDDVAPAGVAAMLAQAKLDLVAAYLYAEGATAPAPATVSGDQGGKTLAPGIYKSTSTLLIQAGDLTLDGHGDANATWIFQVASAFTTVGGAGGNIILTGGAQAKNIFWQTGSSAVIGDYTSFYGNILALQSITMNSHATAVGRMLARNGAVVLTGTNIINKP